MRHIQACKALLLATSVVGGAALIGCSSGTIPAQRLVSPEAAIRGAEEAGAANVPTGALHLQLAREEIGHAKRALDAGDETTAQLFLMRAEADAQLALSLAHETKAKADAQQAAAQVEELRGRTTR